MSIEKMFVVSTDHISQSDIFKLEADIVDGETIGMGSELGYMVYINASVSSFVESRYGSLTPVIREAELSGCVWLMLDFEGPTYETLPSYN